MDWASTLCKRLLGVVEEGTTKKNKMFLSFLSDLELHESEEQQ